MKFGLVFFSLTFSLAVQAKPSIKVRPYLETKTETEIRLADVCEFSEVSPQLQAKLGGVILGDAPQLGERRVFTSQALSQVFRRHLDRVSLGKVNVVIPNKVVVENQGYKVDKSAVTRELVDQWTSQCADCKFKITSLSLPLIPEAMKGKPWQVIAGQRLPRGNFSVQLRVEEFASKQRIFWIGGSVEVHKKVPVLKVSKSIRTRIQKGDIKYEFRNVTFNLGGVVEPSTFADRKLTRSLRAGEILWEHLLVKEKAMRRGDMVKVVVGDAEYQVSLLGEVQEDGFMGDLVRVKNRNSQKVLVGRVIDHGKVRVE